MKSKSIILAVIIAMLVFSGCTQPPDNEPNLSGNPAQEQNQSPEESTPLPDKSPASPETEPKNEPKSEPEESINTSETAAPVANAEDTLSWYFVRNNQHQYPDTNPNYKDMLAQYQGIYIIPNPSQQIYLTFDCGYELGYSGQILDTLASKNIKAAFFITGHYLKTQPDLVKRMQAEGHLVCNHSNNHPDFSTISQAKLQEEITSVANNYYNLTGQEMDKYLRPPMGNFNRTSLEWTKELGYTSVFWSMAWKDWDPQQQPGADYVHQHVLDNIHPGAVILMHAVSQSDTEALAQIITDLQAQGYSFSTFNN